MTTNAQGRSASELSSSLVRDYRAMINSLEHTKPEGPTLPPQAAETSSSVPASSSQASSLKTSSSKAAVAAERKSAEPMIRSLRSAAPESEVRATPLGFAELRSKLSALTDTRGMISPRRPADVAAAPAVEASASPAEAAAEAQSARRRMFGGATRTESEPAARRRRPASSREAFTWQRLGLLTVCIVALGGAAVALQSVVGRDEARVAPEVIGNAAIAAVAPSAPALAVAAPAAEPARVAVVEPAAPPAPILRAIEPASPSPVMPSISARTLLAPEPTEPGPAVRGLTAFAAPEPSPLAAPVAALPRQAPLPPRRAVVAAVSAPAAAAQADEVAGAANASETSGAEPTGGATIRSPVTMRTGPNKGASAMQTLRSGQQVELVACDSWCEIVADGKRGFVYKSFVSAGAPKEADASTTE
ncbi:hypothetical protein KHC28_21735 [Ancylobacter sonchi]|uniref:SH3 domain-containing protein n=1 Tax=Ancylobacter sonchi TaxID=1937790 RepID=UPI001BD457F8|nr:SH3 domain-containing protein [Ancylobacter sonchi]MBS7536276.1 hypothetical protein [Ancylobacter sonchi]